MNSYYSVQLQYENRQKFCLSQNTNGLFRKKKNRIPMDYSNREATEER
jgi:hypothetical protein